MFLRREIIDKNFFGKSNRSRTTKRSEGDKIYKLVQASQRSEEMGSSKDQDIEIETVQKCFRKHQSKKRTVEMKQIEKILKELGLYSEKYMLEFQTACDDNADQLDFAQFTKILDRLCGVTRVEAETQILRDAFDQIDTDHDGFITRDELEAAAPLLDVSVKDTKKMMKAADTNKDGKVDFEEFRAIMGQK